MLLQPTQESIQHYQPTPTLPRPSLPINNPSASVPAAKTPPKDSKLPINISATSSWTKSIHNLYPLSGTPSLGFFKLNRSPSPPTSNIYMDQSLRNIYKLIRSTWWHHGTIPHRLRSSSIVCNNAKILRKRGMITSPTEPSSVMPTFTSKTPDCSTKHMIIGMTRRLASKHGLAFKRFS